jgi:hypothetical protein
METMHPQANTSTVHGMPARGTAISRQSARQATIPANTSPGRVQTWVHARTRFLARQRQRSWGDDPLERRIAAAPPNERVTKLTLQRDISSADSRGGVCKCVDDVDPGLVVCNHPSPWAVTAEPVRSGAGFSMIFVGAGLATLAGAVLLAGWRIRSNLQAAGDPAVRFRWLDVYDRDAVRPVATLWIVVGVFVFLGGVLCVGDTAFLKTDAASCRTDYPRGWKCEAFDLKFSDPCVLPTSTGPRRWGPLDDKVCQCVFTSNSTTAMCDNVAASVPSRDVLANLAGVFITLGIAFVVTFSVPRCCIKS